MLRDAARRAVVVDGDDAGRLLSAMLQRVQPELGERDRVGMTVNAEDAAHRSDADRVARRARRHCARRGCADMMRRDRFVIRVGERGRADALELRDRRSSIVQRPVRGAHDADDARPARRASRAIASTAAGIGRGDDDAPLRLAEEQRARAAAPSSATRSIVAPIWRARSIMQHSASATARPPSAQSCAERTTPPRIASSSASISARSRVEIAARRRAGDDAVNAREILAAAELVGVARRAGRSRRRRSLESASA